MSRDFRKIPLFYLERRRLSSFAIPIIYIAVDIAPYRMVRSDRIFEFSTLVLEKENLVNFSSYIRTSRALTHYCAWAVRFCCVTGLPEPPFQQAVRFHAFLFGWNLKNCYISRNSL